MTDECDCQVRDVDADPAPVETLRGSDRCSTTTERVEDDITFVAGCVDDALQ